MTMNKQSKPRGPQTAFAHLVDTGVRAYQHAKRINGVTRATDDLAFASGIGSSTLGSWRRDVIPTDYAILKRFMMTCLLASSELDESWVSDLLREAGMAGYLDQTLAEIRNPQGRGTLATHKRSAETTRAINIAGSVPALPHYYVTRQTMLDTLKALTLAQRETGGWIGLLGMTGVGKSTLMAALGHDPDIHTAFTGNVRWFEVRQSTTIQRLAQRIALAFGEELSEEYASDNDAVAALRYVLPNEPLLLLLDNVVNPTDISLLHALGAGVVVVVTVRAKQDVALLHVPEKRWITVAELTDAEAWALIGQITTVAEDQIPAAKAVLEAIEYHPYTTVVVGSAAATLKMQWSEIQDALQAITVRWRMVRFLKTKNRNVWAPLEMDWQGLGSTSQYALTTLGRLPYFLHYDLALAEALWGLSAAETVRVWQDLAAMQLARPAPDFPGEYTVHWLIRDFAAEKAKDWPLWRQLRFLGWPWRYRLPFRLRWWWPALRKPESETRWPWYALTLPGTEGRRGLRFVGSWLVTTLWQHNGRQLNLRVGPVEWVTVTRLSVRFLAACIACLYLAVTSLLTLFQGTRPFVMLLAMLSALWIALVAHIDLRRAALWWGLETSLPYTAAFTEENQEKDPVS
jgi:hypothetical protein